MRPAASASSRESSARARLVHAGAPNVDGRTLAEIAEGVEETSGQEVVVPIEAPLKPTGGLAILRGNLAPEGCVVKLAGHERTEHRGPARVFDSEEDCFAAVKARSIEPGDVVVIRYEGPAGGPGMREMLHVTAAIVGEGLSATTSPSSRTAASRAPPTASWSATSRPRRSAAARSRRSGRATRSSIDVDARELRVELSDDELAARLRRLEPAARRATRPASSRSTRRSSRRRRRAPSRDRS